MSRRYLLWHAESSCLFVEYDEEACNTMSIDEISDVTGNPEFEHKYNLERKQRLDEVRGMP